MKNGICPKCNGEEVHLVANTKIEVAINVAREMSYLSYYVCTTCGYTELYVQDFTQLPAIVAQYRKVPVRKN